MDGRAGPCRQDLPAGKDPKQILGRWPGQAQKQTGPIVSLSLAGASASIMTRKLSGILIAYPCGFGYRAPRKTLSKLFSTDKKRTVIVLHRKFTFLFRSFPDGSDRLWHFRALIWRHVCPSEKKRVKLFDRSDHVIQK